MSILKKTSHDVTASDGQKTAETAPARHFELPDCAPQLTLLRPQWMDNRADDLTKAGKCPRCGKAAASEGLLHCCQSRVCVTCIMQIVYRARPAKCPFCEQDPYEAVQRKVKEEEAKNPNEAHITSLVFTRANGIRLPITYCTTAKAIMDVISEKVGMDLSFQVEGGYVDYKLCYRDRYLDLGVTMGDAGWCSGIAKISLICTRTPAAAGPHAE